MSRTRLLLADARTTQLETLVFVKLRRARTEETPYLVAYDRQANAVYQLGTIGEAGADEKGTLSRSWFVGESVVSDGRLFTLTALDPFFILLPILERQAGDNLMRTCEDYLERYCCADDLETPLELQLARLTGLMAMPVVKARLAAMCTCIDLGSTDMVYRLDESKVHALLAQKVQRMLSRIKECPALEKSVRDRAERLDIRDELTRAELARWECSNMIADSLSVYWADWLTRSENFPLLKQHMANCNKAKETMPEFNVLDYTAKYAVSSQPEVKVKAAPTKKPPNTKGMKNISSFFARK